MGSECEEWIVSTDLLVILDEGEGLPKRSKRLFVQGSSAKAGRFVLAETRLRENTQRKAVCVPTVGYSEAVRLAMKVFGSS